NRVRAQSGPCVIEPQANTNIYQCYPASLASDLLNCRLSSLRHSLASRRVCRRVGF
ncbi:hypothetical protein ALC53_08242, partial [Atta colombica]